MNRKIKFRGKPLQGGYPWVYGNAVLQVKRKAYLFENEDKNAEVFPEFDVESSYYVVDGLLEIIPDTIGQYTGLKDANGKEIYEGDIVTIGLWTALVTWNEEFATFALQFCFENKVGRRSLGEWEDTIVIGNIHDNPELLKGGSNEA